MIWSKGSGAWNTIFVTVMLIYRHWAILAYSVKLSDIIALGKCESQYSFCIIIGYNLCQKIDISQSNFCRISSLEFDLYLKMFYPYIYFE